MKRITSVLLTCLLACSLLVACDRDTNSPASSSPEIQYIPNPLTGLEKAADYPNGQRPVAVSVNNLKAATPQSGLSNADIIYEMVAEGGITRLVAVYSDYTNISNVGSVRSARDQQLQCIFPLQAIYIHIGGSTYAREMLARYKYEDKTVDGNYQSVRDAAFYFNDTQYPYAGIEHCWFTNSELIGNAIDKYDIDMSGEPDAIFNFTPYYEENRELTDGTAQEIHFRFSDYIDKEDPVLIYDEARGQYLRWQFQNPHIDADNDIQLGHDNVFILFTTIKPYPDGVLMNVDFASGGYGFYFNGGRYERVRWVKGAPEMPLRIVDMQGNETDIQINPGTSYIAMVDLSEYDNLKIIGSGESTGE